jgi:hypothetical protein
MSAASDKQIDLEVTVVQLREQIEHAHNILDDLGVARRQSPGGLPLTVGGRLSWLLDRHLSQPGPDAGSDHLCLLHVARWCPQHPELGPTWEPLDEVKKLLPKRS